MCLVHSYILSSQFSNGGHVCSFLHCVVFRNNVLLGDVAVDNNGSCRTVRGSICCLTYSFRFVFGARSRPQHKRISEYDRNNSSTSCIGHHYLLYLVINHY